MPRSPRVHVPGGFYHAILRGNHRQAIFHREDDYRTFERILADALVRYGAHLHAYCWMPNHVHLAIQVGEVPLGKLMQLVASRYARWKQGSVPTTGHLFERRYRAKLVDADRYLLGLIRYVHRNPVRAGMVADAADYAWSSHRAYLQRARTDWLAIEPTSSLLGGSPDASLAAYLRFMAEDPPAHELEQIRAAPGRRKAAGPAPEPRPAVANQSSGAQRQLPRALEAIVVEVALEFGVEVILLDSRRRVPSLVRARTEIARRALREGAATLTHVATRLRRAPSSLSELLAKGQKAR